MEEQETNSQKALSATQIGRVSFGIGLVLVLGAAAWVHTSPLAFKRVLSIRGSVVRIDILTNPPVKGWIMWARLTMESTLCPRAWNP